MHPLKVFVLSAVSILVVAACGAVGWHMGVRTGDTAPAAGEASVSEAVQNMPDSVPVVMFLGDSYSKGIGASGNGKRWTTLASAAMGWSEINVAEGGSGYTTRYLGQPTDYGIKLDVVAAAKPDIAIVSGGRNDYEAGAATVTGAAAASLLAAIESAAPDARLIVTSPIWDAGTPPADFAVLIEGVKKAASDAGAEYVDIGEPLAGHQEMMDTDELHPNDAGHRAIAMAVVDAIG